VREVVQAQAESRSLRELVEQSATLTRQAASSMSDYRAAIYALNARSDGHAVILRGGLQAMKEVNRIAEHNRANSPSVQFHIPQIPPDTTAPAKLDYEVT
jgi:hypothetical protein